MRAATYSRYSSDRQRESSIQDQQRNCERRIAAEGWTLISHFCDNALSGSSAERPGYQAMLRAAEAGEFAALLLDDLARLSRDQVESERVIRRLEFRGVRIIGVSDGYDSASRTRKVTRGVRSLLNEVYLDDLRDKTHRGLTGLALSKLSAGGLAYGYLSIALERGFGRAVDPVQVEVVREIFDRFARGETLRAIASELNGRAVPSPGARWKGRRDGLWRVSALHALLHNPIYCGRYVWNVSRWERDPDSRIRKRIARPQSEWITHEMPELRVIDDATWNRVQARLRARAELFKPGRGGRSTYLLSGLLRCGVCGGAYVIGALRPARYGCSTHRHAGAVGCGNGIMVRQDRIEPAVLDPVRRELLSDEAIDLAMQTMRELARQDRDHRSTAALDREIVDIERLKSEGVLSPAVAAAAMDQARTERRALQQPIDGLFGAADDWRAAVEDLRSVIGGEDMPAAREALRKVVGTVQLIPEDGQLWAEIGAQWLPLTGDCNWVGSGGRIWKQLPRFRVA